MTFETENIRIETITKDADYAGARARFLAHLGGARQTMRIDIGFGDAALIQDNLTYPTLLDHPAPILRGYLPESSIAEKYQAMVKLGLINSRMKDYYDIWLLARRFPFEGRRLTDALKQTFDRRDTAFEKRPIGLGNAFATDPAKVAQWRGFLGRAQLKDAPELLEIIRVARDLLLPPTEAILVNAAFDLIWRPPGPWRRKPAGTN